MIRQYLLVFLLALIAVIVQSALLPFLGEVLYVDFLLIMVVVIGLFKDPVNGSIMSAGLGALTDLFASSVMGLHMTARVGVFLAAQAARRRISPETPFFQFTLAIVLCAFDRVLLYLLHLVFYQPLDVNFQVAVLMAAGVLVNAALAPIFLLALRRVPGFTGPARGPGIAR